MKYNTSSLLNDLQNRTETIIQKAVDSWQTFEEALMTFTTQKDKWSAVQCLAHLNSYGRYYLPQIEKAIQSKQKSEPSQSFKSSWLGNYFYQSMLPQVGNKKIKKMKSPKDHVPKTDINVAATIAEFIDQQEKILVLLEKARTINISQAKVPISIAKFVKLQLGDTFLFLIAHIERHVLQAQRMMQKSVHVSETV